MASLLLGGAAALTGVAAVGYWYFFSGSSADELKPADDDAHESSVLKVKTAAELQSLFTKGGKAVVYLTASW
eukprot:2142789-Prymnesium_polylepis.1